MAHSMLASNTVLSRSQFNSRLQTALHILKKYKWTVGSTIAVGGAAYYIWKILNSVPVREILSVIAESNGKVHSEVNAILRSGEGSRMLAACLRDMQGDLSEMFEIQEKQAAARAPGHLAVQERVKAFKELAIASFTRTLSAVYALCLLAVFVHVQLFELKKQRRQGADFHEDAQRRFLSLVQGFRNGNDSPLLKISRRVEASVRRFFDSHSVTGECKISGPHSLIGMLRKGVGRAADSNEEQEATWMAKLMLDVIETKAKELEEGQRVRSPLRSMFSQETDLQLKQLLEMMTEVLESEIFADALTAAVEKAFELLESEIVSKGPGNLEAPANPSAQQNPDSSNEPARPARAAAGSVPLIKLVPVVSNLFGSLLNLKFGNRDESQTFSASILHTDECKNLFLVVTSG